ncbi:hypothetical protein [Pseudomonas citronellolis]|uniref:hypothetical protein n=1 Tax=Pseudomonas citronellolis TaxID=53408 RepID=UPI0023E3DC88|nr:hypothetical protein [Pseudomonas citronellolis]MDF3931601.1 hypothetical protein [Pseudomonas citronellolis]
MKLRHLLCVSLLACAGPLCAADAPVAHGQFLPPDDGNLRAEAPEQQQLLQVTEYSVVLGNQRQSNQQPIPITTPALLRLKGKALNKGGAATQVLISFDSEGKSLKKPSYDAASRTLSLSYPAASYTQLLDLLRHGPVYCQFLSYPNGHVWADLHSGAVRVR